MIKAGGNKILFITQWQYNDALIQTYTLPYIRIVQNITGCYTYLIATTKKTSSIKISKRQNVVLIELPVSKSFLLLRWFFNIIAIRRIVRRKKISVLHTMCTPAGSIGALLKILNRKLMLILDSVEPHAESMVEGGQWKKGNMKFRLLFYMEKKQVKVADKLIMAAEGMDRYIFKKYGIVVTDFQIKPACVDLNLFSGSVIKDKQLLAQYNLTDKITCLYAGKLGGFYLDDELFAFVKQCENYWGITKFRFLMLSGEDGAYVNKQRIKHEIDDDTLIKLFVPHKDVPKYMGMADFAVSPFKLLPSKRYSTPIKNGEYMALGLPIVITPNISTDSDIIAQNYAGAIIETLNEVGYLNAIKRIESLLINNSRQEIYNRIRPLAEKYRNFTIAEEAYRLVYDSL